jgi:hypothetical protein
MRGEAMRTKVLQTLAAREIENHNYRRCVGRRVRLVAAAVLAAFGLTVFSASPADAAVRVDARLSQTCDSRTNVVTAVLRLENWSWPEPVWGGRVRVSYYDLNRGTWSTGTWTYVSLPAGEVQQFRHTRQLGESVYRTVVEVQPLTSIYAQNPFGPSLPVQVSSHHWWSAGYWAGNTGDRCYMNLQ